MNVNDNPRADRLSQAFREAIRARIVAAVDNGESWAGASRATGIAPANMSRHFASGQLQTKELPLTDVIAVVAWLHSVDGGPEFDEFYRLATQHVE